MFPVLFKINIVSSFEPAIISISPSLLMSLAFSVDIVALGI